MKAYNQCGDSPYSNSACAKTTPCYYCDPWGMKITPDKKIINSGEPVTYTYEVENKGKVDFTDIELVDDKFGIVVTKYFQKSRDQKL